MRHIKNIRNTFSMNFEYSDELRNNFNERNLFIKSNFRGRFDMLSLEADIYIDYNTLYLIQYQGVRERKRNSSNCYYCYRTFYIVGT